MNWKRSWRAGEGRVMVAARRGPGRSDEETLLRRERRITRENFKIIRSKQLDEAKNKDNRERKGSEAARGRAVAQRAKVHDNESSSRARGTRQLEEKRDEWAKEFNNGEHRTKVEDYIVRRNGGKKRGRMRKRRKTKTRGGLGLIHSLRRWGNAAFPASLLSLFHLSLLLLPSPHSSCSFNSC